MSSNYLSYKNGVYKIVVKNGEKTGDISVRVHMQTGVLQIQFCYKTETVTLQYQLPEFFDVGQISAKNTEDATEIEVATEAEDVIVAVM